MKKYIYTLMLILIGITTSQAQRMLPKQKGLEVKLADKVLDNVKYIQLRLGNVTAPLNQSEAYHLETTADKIVITANTSQGIYSGIQTLVQLMRNNVFVDASEITDWPAFAWRGFMVDVGDRKSVV